MDHTERKTELDVDASRTAPTDPDGKAIQEVINKVKSQGLFDQLRKECLSDVDTKPAYQNLIQRVEKFVEKFLNGQKWNAHVNKNQLRESLRRQLNNSGVMTMGVERIIEQVVNPKILLGIKPKIDEAVCEHLGINLKARQEAQKRRKQEHQNLILQHHQQQFQSQTPNENFADNQGHPPLGALPWPHAQGNARGHAFMGDMATAKANALDSAAPPGPFNQPAIGFSGIPQPIGFMSGWSTGLPGMEGFNQSVPNMVPGQPMIPNFGSGLPPTSIYSSPGAGSATTSSLATETTPTRSVPDLSKPPPSVVSTASSSISSPAGSVLQSSPIAPPGMTPGSLIRPPPIGSVPPPPGTVPVSPLLTSAVPPASSQLPPPTTPTIPALISHTLSKVSQDNLTPERIAVFKTAAAFITKTVSNAQTKPGTDLASMFSPRVLAEAMMEENGKPKTKQELRAARRKERQKEFERLKAERDKELEQKDTVEEDKEDPLPAKSNLMDVFQAAEDVSDDEEALDLMDVEETDEDPHKQGIVLSASDNEGDEEQAPTSVPGKRYNFAWDVDKESEISDASVSSIHTSDLSAYEDMSSSGSDSDSDHCENDQIVPVQQEPESEPEQVLIEEIETGKTNAVSEDPPVEMLVQGEAGEVNDSEGIKTNPCDASNGILALETTVVTSENVISSLPTEVQGEIIDGRSELVTEMESNKKEVQISVDNSESVISQAATRKELEEPSAEAVKTEETVSNVLGQNGSELVVTITGDAPATSDTSALLETATESHEAPAVCAVSVSAGHEPQPNTSQVKTAAGERDSKKPRKLLSLSHRYSDSDEEETREERKARIAKEKEERYLKRQQRRAEMELKKKEREEEKARLKEERKKLKNLKGVEGKTQSATTDVSTAEEVNASVISHDSPTKTTPRRKKNKAELKEQLLQQKVMERKAALRRRRTRNKKYTSDEFTSIFSQHKNLNQSYTNSDIVTFDTLEVVEMTVDQECTIVSVETDENATNKDESTLQCSSPYSDISDRSMSGSDGKKEAVEMEAVSSDDDLGVDEVCDELGDVDTEKIDASSPKVPESEDSLKETDNLKEDVDSVVISKASTGSRARSQSNLSQESGGTSMSVTDVKSPIQDTNSKVSDVDDKLSQQSAPLTVETPAVEGESQEESRKSQEREADAAEPINVMANLELEPVSDEDSPFGDFDSEKDSSEGEAEDEKDTKSKLPFEKIPVIEDKTVVLSKDEEADPDASDEGEIKSDSDDAKKEEEEEKERQKKRKPIELVDFGEAARRSREARMGFVSESPDKGTQSRGLTVTSAQSSSYRKNYTSWTGAESSAHGQYPQTVSRYVNSRDRNSPPLAHGKSPIAGSFDGIESEASSHSRSSIRLRDNAPLPYPIDHPTSSHKRRSPGADKVASHVKQTSPSPVSSMSSRSSRSRSSSSKRSRSSSGSSSSRSPSSSRRSHNSKQSSRRKRRKARKRKKASLKSHSPSRKFSVCELTASKSYRDSPMKNYTDVPIIPLEPQRQTAGLSSGHESISSDELPDFPDEGAPVPPPVSKKRKKSEEGQRSTSSSMSGESQKAKKRRRNDSQGQDSISSSDLIYSPTRQSKPAEKDDDEQSIERPPMSPAGSSISCGEFPDYQGPLVRTGFSPHRPISPSELPPLPEDIDGFQPPLPDEVHPFPHEQPPLPPLPPDSEEEEIRQPPEPPPIPTTSLDTPHPFTESEQEEGEISDNSLKAESEEKRTVVRKHSPLHTAVEPVIEQSELSEKKNVSRHFMTSADSCQPDLPAEIQQQQTSSSRFRESKQELLSSTVSTCTDQPKEQVKLEIESEGQKNASDSMNTNRSPSCLKEDVCLRSDEMTSNSGSTHETKDPTQDVNSITETSVTDSTCSNFNNATTPLDTKTNTEASGSNLESTKIENEESDVNLICTDSSKEEKNTPEQSQDFSASDPVADFHLNAKEPEVTVNTSVSASDSAFNAHGQQEQSSPSVSLPDVKINTSSEQDQSELKGEQHLHDVSEADISKQTSYRSCEEEATVCALEEKTSSQDPSGISSRKRKFSEDKFEGGNLDSTSSDMKRTKQDFDSPTSNS